MDNPNAFIGCTVKPTPDELATELGPTSALWDQLVETLMKEPGVIDLEWHSLKPKYGWTLILKSKKRRIVYLGPCAGCFRASFVLGDKAMAAARVTKFAKVYRHIARNAPHYPEGTGVTILVKNAKDLPAIRKLAQIKLAN